MLSAALALLVAAAPASEARAPPAAEPARVAAARADKLDDVHAMFAAAGVAYPPREVLLRSFKAEGVLELWAASRRGGPLALVKSYAVCASSGELGPKRQQGDLQVPEGFYAIDALNPWSTFHLSLHVDYPNAADVARARAQEPRPRDLGGAIMVHGNCVTIGCIPIEDDPIEEVYLVVLDSKRAGAKTPIHIFPRRLDDAGAAALAQLDASDDTRALWEQLAAGYRAFEATRKVPRVRVDAKGRYVVTPR